jgi:hypothetical protein
LYSNHDLLGFQNANLDDFCLWLVDVTMRWRAPRLNLSPASCARQILSVSSRRRRPSTRALAQCRYVRSEHGTLPPHIRVGCISCCELSARKWWKQWPGAGKRRSFGERRLHLRQTPPTRDRSAHSLFVDAAGECRGGRPEAAPGGNCADRRGAFQIDPSPLLSLRAGNGSSCPSPDLAEFDRGSVKSHETAAFTWASVER